MVVYGAGGIVVLWLAATIVGALNNIPLVRPQPPGNGSLHVWVVLIVGRAPHAPSPS